MSLAAVWEGRRNPGVFNVFMSEWEDAPAALPEGVTAWAIGDIHGHLGHFEALLRAIETLIPEAPGGPRHLIVMGDTIDRGPDNIATLERVGALEIPGVTVTALWGNHEQFLQKFLTGTNLDGAFLDHWAMNGGHTTLANLGVSPIDARRFGVKAVIEQGRSMASPALKRALDNLRIGVKLGDYVFVHAGVHPHYPLEDEGRQQLTEMREPFLTGAGWIHPFAVVHGHSIVGPGIERHRVAVDSGAYFTGVLSAVELNGRRARFIAATQDSTLDALGRIEGRRPLSSETWRKV